MIVMGTFIYLAFDFKKYFKCIENIISYDEMYG